MVKSEAEAAGICVATIFISAQMSKTKGGIKGNQNNIPKQHQALSEQGTRNCDNISDKKGLILRASLFL